MGFPSRCYDLHMRGIRRGVADSLREQLGQCTCECWNGAKVAGSTSVLAHQFPPPLLSMHLCQLNGWGIGHVRFWS